MGRVLRHSSSVTRVTKAGEAVDPSRIYRLSDMEVEEVSMVDRAANKKKFLVVKRDGDQMTTQVHPDGKGGFTTAGDTTKAGAPPVPPAAGAPGKKPPPGKDKKPAPAAKAGGLEVPPGFKEAMAPLLEKTAERLQALADNVDSSTPADMGDEGEMPGVPPEFMNELSAIVGLLEKAGAMWPNAPPELTDSETEDGTIPEGGEATGPAVTEMQLRAAEKSIGALAKFAKRAVAKKDVIAKIGAKMSKDRLTRLQQAVGALSNLVNEVAGAPPEPPNVEKSDKAPAWAAELTKSVAGLGAVVKQTVADVSAIKKSRGLPASQGTGDVGGGAPTGDEAVSWPMDMNRPITRGNVEKSESFFDEDNKF